METLDKTVEMLQLELEKANRELKKLRNLFNQTKDAIVITDPETGRFLDFNASFCDNLGYTHDELSSMKVMDIQSTVRDQNTWLKMVQNIKENGSMILHGTHKRKNGTHFPVEVNARYVSEDNQKYCVAAIRDISERVKSTENLIAKNEELQKQYSQLEELYKNIPIGLCLMDKDLRYIRINDKLANINGLDKDLHIGRTAREVIPQIANEVEHFNQSVFDTGDPIINMEITGKTPAEPDIEKSWLVSYYPVKSFDGDICFVGTIVIDVSKRKEAEKSLKESESLFRMISENAPIMIDAFDPNGKCLLWNKECEKVFGWSKEEILAHKNPLELFYPDPETQKQVIESIIKKPEKSFQEWNPITKDGKELSCLWANFKLPDGNIMSLGHDVTKLRKSEKDLSQLKEQLLHTTRKETMGELSSAIAHEINQPLAAIMSNAQAAQRFLDKNDPPLDKVREILTDIVDNDRRAGDIIRKLRLLLKKDKSEFEQININDVVEDTLILTNSNLVIKNVHIQKFLEEDIPFILGDQTQLQQVLLNLILNALASFQSSKKDTNKINIITKCKSKKEILLTIEDTGTGLDKTQLEKIFEPFVTTKENGMGMGLAINRTIINAHKGHIWAKNNKNQGATFHIALPIITAKDKVQ